MKLKRNILLLFFLLAGIVVGAMLASVTANVGFLSWLAYTGQIGFSPENPFILDLDIIRLSFGFVMKISVAQIITIALAIFLYNKTSIR